MGGAGISTGIIETAAKHQQNREVCAEKFFAPALDADVNACILIVSVYR
jgi:hypothetical protein